MNFKIICGVANKYIMHRKYELTHEAGFIFENGLQFSVS
jgi:hypothetical protein